MKNEKNTYLDVNIPALEITMNPAPDAGSPVLGEIVHSIVAANLASPKKSYDVAVQFATVTTTCRATRRSTVGPDRRRRKRRCYELRSDDDASWRRAGRGASRRRRGAWHPRRRRARAWELAGIASEPRVDKTRAALARECEVAVGGVYRIRSRVNVPDTGHARSLAVCSLALANFPARHSGTTVDRLEKIPTPNALAS